jgi:hypothetical protein
MVRRTSLLRILPPAGSLPAGLPAARNASRYRIISLSHYRIIASSLYRFIASSLYRIIAL